MRSDSTGNRWRTVMEMSRKTDRGDFRRQNHNGKTAQCKLGLQLIAEEDNLNSATCLLDPDKPKLVNACVGRMVLTVIR